MSDAQKATIIIGNAHALRIFTQMLEKHEKGTLATKNTVESFGGDSHAMDGVVQYIAEWRRQTALQGELLAPKGDDAVAGTPMGAVLEQVSAGDSIAWDNSVPSPRPTAGQLVRWPTGQTESIVTVIGYDAAADAFSVVSGEAHDCAVVAHYADGGALEWWLLSLLLDYTAPRRAVDDTPRAESPAEAAARAADAELGETLDGDQRAEGKKANAEIKKAVAKGVSKQRARNTQAAGLTAGRAVPKPGAGKKKGGQ